MPTQSRIYSGNTVDLRPGIRQAIRVFLESIPFLGDVFHARYVFPRTETACLGVYDSMDDARRAAETDANTDYDACNEQRSVEADIERISRFDYEDYPVLFWLQGLVCPGLKVTDLGGSTGETFYAFSEPLGFPENFSWTVVELPAAAEKGRLVAEARDEKRLKFETDINRVANHDVLLTIGALQYMPETLVEMIEAMKSPPRYVIVHKIPITDGPSFWTVQNLGVARVPYYIQNRQGLVDEMHALGFGLVDSCDTLRSIRIPFHSDKDVQRYSGFLFRYGTGL